MIEEKLKKYTDLSSEKIGGRVVYATDEFFAEKENLIKEGRGVFIPDKYTERGKWMDGWESRRKRTEGHDWAIIKLGAEGIIKGFDIDTNHFLGNHPPFASVEAINLGNENLFWSKANELEWDEILPKSPLEPGSQHFFEIDFDTIYTHVRLHIYPDGGVANPLATAVLPEPIPPTKPTTRLWLGFFAKGNVRNEDSRRVSWDGKMLETS